MADRFPQQRWNLATPQPELADQLSQATELPELLTQILLNRGITTPDAAAMFLNPELQILPSPLEEFEDLPIALELLLRAIAERQYIAICGDYDADGMTSTALLLRALRYLGATVEYAIPSRMQEGYGINRRIIEEFHAEGVGLILTVDNGIAAYDPIARARELGMAVIVTDHHDIPPQLPPANAILNPKLIRPESPYRGAAGVGVAYILAVCLAQSLQKTQDLTTPLIELFTLGTIADLAPLTGVNRRWVKRGLKLLPKSRIAGIQALIQVAGLSQETTLKPEAIGFRLGPRINAIGRLADPQIVIELLITDEDGRALELAMKCEQVNQLRQRLCELIEQEAIAWCLETQFNPQQERVLVIVQPGWHHGVIGIVASRLVERYGVPVFIGTLEEPAETGSAEIDGAEIESTATERENIGPSEPAKIRGSARGIPEFDVFEALQFCHDLLGKFGGHRAAGGFTFEAAHLEAVRERLREFAHQSLRPEHLKPLVTVDAEANFRELTLELYQQMDVLHPCGIENPDPVFWTPNVRVVEQRQIGQNQAHLKVTLSQTVDPTYSLRAIAWRWGVYYPLPNQVDVAYKLRLNEWQGVCSVELELVGMRVSQPAGSADLLRSESQPAPRLSEMAQLSLEPDSSKTAHLEISGYSHRVKRVAVQPDHPGHTPDVSNNPHLSLSQTISKNSIAIEAEDTAIRSLEKIIQQKDQQIATLSQQLESLQQQFEILQQQSDQLQIFQQLAQPTPELPPATAQVSALTLVQLKPDDPKPWLRNQLGEAVWTSLDARSQKDLIAAYKKYALLQASLELPDLEKATVEMVIAEMTAEMTTISPDYSDVGLRLCSVIERELIQPFFRELHQFLLQAGEPCEIGGVALRTRKKYTLGMLPPLLAAEWQTFHEEALSTRSPASCLYAPALAAPIDSTDRETVQIFLAQWEQPLGRWLDRQTDFQAVASTLAQIDRLLTLAADAESQLLDWQFQLLQTLIMDQTTGLLQQVYADT